MATMTFDNPRYQEFLDGLQEALNLREDGSHDCTHSLDRPLTRTVLRSMGHSEPEVASSLAFMSARGGFCDHEILLDVGLTDVDRATIDEQEG